MAWTDQRTRFDVNISGIGTIVINGADPIPVHDWAPGTYDLVIAPVYVPAPHFPDDPGGHGPDQGGGGAAGSGAEPGSQR